MSPAAASASTIAKSLKARLDTPARLDSHLRALVAIDSRLKMVWARAGEVELRTAPKGFAGLARVICGQQLSTASAGAIWKRVAALPGATTPAGFLALSEEKLRAAGLSRAKVVSMRAAAEAAVAGTLDFAAVEELPAEQAVAHLSAVHGVGPWTAEIYLLFCVGHPDVFPAGDLALKKAAMDGLGLAQLPSTRELVEIAKGWTPHRGAAALLLWRFFHVLHDRVGVAV